jgi:pimeloyl-ACP methyl ester carboxylesterase
MDLHFEVFGQSEPLVILHGLFGSLQNWRVISKRFAEKFKVFAVDQRNHGLSPHSSEMDYRLMATDVLDLMTNQRVPEAFVLGHSMGGKTAMQLALMHPGAVRKLVVVDMAPHADPPRHEGIIAGMLALELNQFQSRKEIETALASPVPDLVMRQFLLKNVERNQTGGFRWKIGLAEIGKNYTRLREAITGDEPFDKPALFIRGEKSGFLSEQDLGLIHCFFPRAVMQTVSGAGHLVHFDKPDAFTELVFAFLHA